MFTDNVLQGKEKEVVHLKTGVLIHGCHLQAKDWERMVWGEPPHLMGRVPSGIYLTIREDAQRIIFGTGASQTTDGVLEGQHTLNMLAERFAELSQFTAITNLLGPDVEYMKEEILTRCLAETTSQNTMQEFGTVGRIFVNEGIERVFLVSGSTHIARCLMNALQACQRDKEIAHLARHLYAHASDVPYADSTINDVVIIEPPHRGDRIHTDLHQIMRGVFSIPAERQLAFCDDLRRLIAQHKE